MASPALWAALLFGTTSPTHPMPTVQIVVIDRDNILIRSAEPIDSLQFEDLYENTDYVVEMFPKRKEARIRLLTGRGPLKLLVDTEVARGSGIVRRRAVTIANPGNVRRID